MFHWILHHTHTHCITIHFAHKQCTTRYCTSMRAHTHTHTHNLYHRTLYTPDTLHAHTLYHKIQHTHDVPSDTTHTGYVSTRHCACTHLVPSDTVHMWCTTRCYTHTHKWCTTRHCTWTNCVPLDTVHTHTIYHQILHADKLWALHTSVSIHKHNCANLIFMVNSVWLCKCRC